MRNATKILLIITEVFSFVMLATYLIFGIVLIALGANEDFLIQILNQSGMVGYETKTMMVTFITMGIVLIFPGLISLGVGILTINCRKQFAMGCSKDQMKKKAIGLIVLGALSFELPIVPAIFMLTMGEANFQEQPTQVK